MRTPRSPTFFTISIPFLSPEYRSWNRPSLHSLLVAFRNRCHIVLCSCAVEDLLSHSQRQLFEFEVAFEKSLAVARRQLDVPLSAAALRNLSNEASS
ncbi:hypothetical protein Nepgr_000434 [Nepenthes gracilis]|uniref:Uncharacterized protein n=1 Tax=Nepenthes gracilis TaxID=150966 RepID=A0AAD3RWQ6_NEPGR|nr:hypothetical protein Nepgr_000434 [Nepenthes gracilis]